MIGVLLCAYGAPDSIDQLGEYYKHIRHGKAPDRDELKAVKERYRQLKTVDLLRSVTQRQAEGLAHALKQGTSERFQVYTAFKHTSPFVEETVERMVQDGVDRIFTLPLSPLYSKTGTGLYQHQVRKTIEKSGYQVNVFDIDYWHLHPQLINVLSGRLRLALQWLPQNVKQKTSVIFTAHSQPGKPETHRAYIDSFTQLAQRLADEVQLTRWLLAYRSAGSHEEKWLGPDIKEVIITEGKIGTKGIVVCDLLSLTANVEVLYDLGEVCRQLCKRFGMEFVRAEFANDAYDFVLALSQIVRERVHASSCDQCRE
jgi:ferrochelatase